MSDLDGTILTTLKSPGKMPYGLAFDGTHLWVSDREERKITKMDPASGQQLFAINFDGELTGTAWDGSHIWQADQTSRTISRINPETGEIALAIKVDMPTGDVTGLSFEDGGLWYGLSRLGQARKVKDTDGSFLKAFPTRGDICGIVIVGKHLYYSEPADAKVHKMEANTGSILISYNVGGKPTGLTHDGEAFWICDQESNEIKRLKF